MTRDRYVTACAFGASLTVASLSGHVMIDRRSWLAGEIFCLALSLTFLLFVMLVSFAWRWPAVSVQRELAAARRLPRRSEVEPVRGPSEQEPPDSPARPTPPRFVEPSRYVQQPEPEQPAPPAAGARVRSRHSGPCADEQPPRENPPTAVMGAVPQQPYRDYVTAPDRGYYDVHQLARQAADAAS